MLRDKKSYPKNLSLLWEIGANNYQIRYFTVYQKLGREGLSGFPQNA
jgi:hypothetical protein